MKYTLAFFFILLTAYSQEIPEKVSALLERYCSDCHAAGVSKGGLDLDELKYDLKDKKYYAKWQAIYDNIINGDMPPKKKKKRPTSDDFKVLDDYLGRELFLAHSSTKTTVLRRMNREEYQNTLNDLFGTDLNLTKVLPEDNESHGFYNLGASLDVSMQHLKSYMEASNLIIDEAFRLFLRPKNPLKVNYTLESTPAIKSVIGKNYKKLDDGAVVRYNAGYPHSVISYSRVKRGGYYKISVTGYAHESEKPLYFTIGSRSAKQKTDINYYGLYKFEPNKEATVECVTYLPANYDIQVEPYQLPMLPKDIKDRKKANIHLYNGPGLAIKKITLTGPILVDRVHEEKISVLNSIPREQIMPKYKHQLKISNFQLNYKIVSTNPVEDARKVLDTIAKRTFASEEYNTQPYLDLFKQEYELNQNFEDALRTALLGILNSRDFLYINENSGELSDVALAQRLSYFINRSFPDKQLLDRAANKELASNKNVLGDELKRLLTKPQFERFIKDFTDAWLSLKSIEATQPDSRLYPEYDPVLNHFSVQETRLFVKELIIANLPVKNIIKSDFSMLNSRLAKHYGISGVDHTDIRKVQLPEDSVRGGILSQSSILKVSADGTTTSPILRGVWVLERILGIIPPPPPENVPGVEPDIRGAKTLRELLAKHRSTGNCNSCHSKIDPLGFALEGFDPTGFYRETFRTLGNGKKVDQKMNGKQVRYRLGGPVDSSGEFSSGHKFKDFREFRDHLAKDEEALTKAMTEKLLTFASGREMGFSDRPEIDRIVQEISSDGYRFQDLLLEVVKSKIFLTK
ncbi:MAG: DUF1592 domain-containing protein [Lentisphaeraceae bacterium]|nr:DUF1592 domain-containing protein [Lentisphaeraceae bacterium]